MAKSKLYCAEHKRAFQGGQGFAAHLRRFHPNLPQPTNGHRGPQLAKGTLPEPATEKHQAYTHLDAALLSVNKQIANAETGLNVLRTQRDHIAAALGEDYIPF